MVALQHGGLPADQLQKFLPRRGRHRQADQRADAAPDLGQVDDGGVSLDDPLLFQPPDPLGDAGGVSETCAAISLTLIRAFWVKRVRICLSNVSIFSESSKFYEK